jgi:hypothetical protein
MIRHVLEPSSSVARRWRTIRRLPGRRPDRCAARCRPPCPGPRCHPALLHWLGRCPGIELAGRRLGVVGYGAVGCHVAGIADALGMEVVATDPVVREADVPLVDLATLLASSDAVTLHAPPSDDTRGMIGVAELDGMRPQALLVNASRGGHPPPLQRSCLARVRSGGKPAAGVMGHDPVGPQGHARQPQSRHQARTGRPQRRPRARLTVSGRRAPTPCRPMSRRHGLYPMPRRGLHRRLLVARLSASLSITQSERRLLGGQG